MTMTLNGSGTGTVGVPNSATAQNSTSGTSIDFTGIPAGIKRITVMFNGVSTNGTSNVQVQIGSGGITTTGYSETHTYVGAGSTGSTSGTTGFILHSAQATNTRVGVMTLCLMGSNTWVCGYTMATTAGDILGLTGAGSVALSGTLDRIRITTVNGTDTFDAGSINILYE